MTKPPDLNDLKRAGADLSLAALEAASTPMEGTPEAELPPRIGTFAGAAVARMRRRANGAEVPIPLPWGSVNDALSGGLWPGMLYVLAGGTGSGKTIWALEAALAAARSGVPVLYVSLELGADEMIARLLGLMSRERWSDLYLGRARDGENAAGIIDDAHGDHADELGDLPIHLQVGEVMGTHAERLLLAAHAMRESLPQDKRGARPFLVVLDYLQLLAREPREDARSAVQRASGIVRAIARDLDAAVLVLSSVARGEYGNLKIDPEEDGLPAPSAFVGIGKESGEIEFCADVALALAAGPWNEAAGSKLVHLAVAKFRAGRDSWTPLKFNGGRFTEPARQEVKAYSITPAKRGKGKGGKK